MAEQAQTRRTKTGTARDVQEVRPPAQYHCRYKSGKVTILDSAGLSEPRKNALKVRLTVLLGEMAPSAAGGVDIEIRWSVAPADDDAVATGLQQLAPLVEQALHRGEPEPSVTVPSAGLTATLRRVPSTAKLDAVEIECWLGSRGEWVRANSGAQNKLLKDLLLSVLIQAESTPPDPQREPLRLSMRSNKAFRLALSASPALLEDQIALREKLRAVLPDVVAKFGQPGGQRLRVDVDSGTLKWVQTIDVKKPGDTPGVDDAALATVPLPRLLSAAEARIAESLDSIAISPTTAKSTLPAKLKELEDTLKKLQDPVRSELRKFIDEINQLPADQRTMGSLEGNKLFTSTLQRLLSTVGERLCCPNCGQQGTLRCKSGNSPSGVFEFVHSQSEKRTGHGGWARLPTLTLTNTT